MTARTEMCRNKARENVHLPIERRVDGALSAVFSVVCFGPQQVFVVRHYLFLCCGCASLGLFGRWREFYNFLTRKYAVVLFITACFGAFL